MTPLDGLKTWVMKNTNTLMLMSGEIIIAVVAPGTAVMLTTLKGLWKIIFPTL